MAKKQKKESSKLSIHKIWIPILIGLAFTAYLMNKNLNGFSFSKSKTGSFAWVDHNADKVVSKSELIPFDQGMHEGLERYDLIKNADILSATEFTWSMLFFLALGVVLVILRDVGYMWRLRILSDKSLSWMSCFRSIMLWEFSSAVTPSVVGGSGVAIFILNKEGLKLGTSTAVVMITALMDELFYVLMVPLVIAIVGVDNLFPVELEKVIFGITLNTEALFWVGYGFLVFLTIFILFAILFFPSTLRNLLIRIFSLPLLHRWRMKVGKMGDDMVLTSQKMKGKPIVFWLKGFLATILSWTSRYWVVNFLILAFGPLNQHFMVYARQLVMWVIMLISPTPGGAGIAEIAFTGFLSEFTPLGYAAVLAILWRLFTYYPYLIMGAVILPKWLQKKAHTST